MRIDDTMHQAQVAIMHVLLFRPSAPFAELQKASGLSSDHFSFHIKQMLDQDVLRKNKAGEYELTHKGKEFANRFDTDAKTIERQPKSAVLLMVEREDGKFLTQQRLKQPFYGYWGRMSGKIRWGETMLQAAERELMEETGLTADLEFKGVYHKMDYNQLTGEILEDKIFFIVAGKNPKGTLLEKFDGGRNAWLTMEEVKAKELVFDGMDEVTKIAQSPGIGFYEGQHHHNPDRY